MSHGFLGGPYLRLAAVGASTSASASCIRVRVFAAGRIRCLTDRLAWCRPLPARAMRDRRRVVHSARWWVRVFEVGLAGRFVG